MENITGEEQSGIMMGNNNEESIDVVKLLVLFRMEMAQGQTAVLPQHLRQQRKYHTQHTELDHHAINRHRTELYHR